MPGSPTVVILMGVLALAVAALFVVGVWRATRSVRTTFLVAFALSILLTAQHFAAVYGLLLNFDRFPPPLLLVVVGMTAVTVAFAFSKTGSQLARQTSFAALVGSQAFRLPLELVMHKAAMEGVMPLQMSYSGNNLDILTGPSALVLSILLAMGKVPIPVVRLWNAAGFVLLVNIVSIAILSLPMFAAFGTDRVNTWVAYPIIVWLPGVLVPAALLGHLLIWRKLALQRS
jgi:hypothetical protein